tara:strand:+ start:36 stop:161 length:126 start_codon:yes stop_codon:yes gene_type:complete
VQVITKRKLKKNAQGEFQRNLINIQKILKEKNIEDKEDNYG